MKAMLQTKKLTMGMYVADLDRPWLDTPFMFHGFRITNRDELQRLSEFCDFVFIDTDRSTVKVAEPDDLPGEGDVNQSVDIHQVIAPPTYQTLFETELPRAQEIYQQTIDNVDNIFCDVRENNHIDAAIVKYTVGSIVDSIIRNPDALMLLCRLNNHMDDAINHAIRVCVLSATFGRYLEFRKNQLVELSIGALLHDIGEIRVPRELLLNQDELSPEEKIVVEDHVNFGAAILSNAPNLPKSTSIIARDHHEYNNGTGYPNQLSGEQISKFTHIVSLVDVFDNVTSGLYGRFPVSITEALRSLYSLRNIHFDALLAEQFVHCLGIYPVGSTVELKSGETGIVLSINQNNRLLPKLLFFEEKAGITQKCKVVDLSRLKTDEQLKRNEIIKVLNIKALSQELIESII